MVLPGEGVQFKIAAQGSFIVGHAELQSMALGLADGATDGTLHPVPQGIRPRGEIQFVTMKAGWKGRGRGGRKRSSAQFQVFPAMLPGESFERRLQVGEGDSVR